MIEAIIFGGIGFLFLGFGLCGLVYVGFSVYMSIRNRIETGR